MDVKGVTSGARLRTALFTIITALAAQMLWAAGPKVAFDIPASDFSQAIVEFYKQSKVEVIYTSPSSIASLRTPAVSGELEVDVALAKLLEGTGFTFEFENAHSVLLMRPGEEGPAAAAVAQNGVAGSGPFVESVASSMSTLASAAEPVPQDVVVTGTFIHGVLDIMSPLVRVDKGVVRSTPYATVQDALQTLPINSGGFGDDVPGSSGNYNRGTAPNLRGLGYGATLVLVNGRRQPLAGSAADFVDLSNIPWSAVERIEVLPDGTSALYGSDAIAGVVNIILREDLNGAETQGRLASAIGGSDERVFSQLFGGQWSSGKWLGSYQFSERGALAAASRDYAASDDKTPFGGTDHRSAFGSPGNILDPGSLEPMLAIPSNQDGSPLTRADLLPGVVNRRNTFANYDLTPERRMHSLLLSGSQKVGDRVEFYGEARLNNRSAEQRQFQPNQMLFVPSTNPFFVRDFDQPFAVVGYSFDKELGPAGLSGRTHSYEGVLGLRATLGRQWHLNFAGSYGREDLRWTEFNLADPEKLEAALWSEDRLTAFNPFGDGSGNSKAVLDSIRTTYKSKIMSDIKVANLVADGALFEMPTGVVKLALGAEARREDLEQHLARRDSADFGRNIASIFTELSLPLVGERDEPRSIPRLELSLAGRYEKYSDFGDSFNPKIGLRWVPLSWAKLRTSWGTSFKAPKLLDLNDTTENAAALITMPDPQSDSGASPVLVRQGNNRNLKEETARTWTLGIDLAPSGIRGLTMSLTYYDIDYEGRILRPGPASPFDILFQESQWADAIIRAPSPQQVAEVCNSPEYIKLSPDENCVKSTPAAIVDFRLRNMAITRTNGIDLKLDYSFDTRVGGFQFDVAGNRAFKFDQALSRTAVAQNVVDTIGNPLALRLRASLDWEQHGYSRGGFNAGFTLDHSGGYQDVDVSVVRGVDSFTTLDLRVGYHQPQGTGFLSDAEITLSAVNIFNKGPPFIDRSFGYDIMNADPTGRVVALYVSKHW